MAMLSDFFIAVSPDGYRGGREFPAEDRCQATRISPLEAAAMLAVIRGEGDAVELTDEFVLLTPEEAESWTMSVPQDFVEVLAAATPLEVAALSEKFAVATTEELGWSASDFAPLVASLGALAQRAQATERKMFLWLSM